MTQVQLERRLVIIEQRVGQLVLNQANFENVANNLRATVNDLQNFKLELETEAKARKQSEEVREKAAKVAMLRIGTLITIATAVVQAVFKFWPK